MVDGYPLTREGQGSRHCERMQMTEKTARQKLDEWDDPQGLVDALIHAENWITAILVLGEISKQTGIPLEHGSDETGLFVSLGGEFGICALDQDGGFFHMGG